MSSGKSVGTQQLRPPQGPSIAALPAHGCELARLVIPTPSGGKMTIATMTTKIIPFEKHRNRISMIPNVESRSERAESELCHNGAH